MPPPVITATDDTLKDLYAAGKPLVILLYSGDLPKPLADAAAKLAKKHADELSVAVLSVDANPKTAAKYNAVLMPGLVAMEQRPFGVREKSVAGEVTPSDVRAYAAYLLGSGGDPAQRAAEKRPPRTEPGASQTATDQTFKKVVLRSKQPVLVDFWAPWCGPCQQVSPMVEQIGADYRGKLRVVKVNVDDNPKLSKTYNILSIPTLMVFAEGTLVERVVGAQPRRVVEKMIEKALL